MSVEGTHHDCVRAGCIYVTCVLVQLQGDDLIGADRVLLKIKVRQRQVEVLLNADVLRPGSHRIDELLAGRDRCDYRGRLLQVSTWCRLAPDLTRPSSGSLHAAV